MNFIFLVLTFAVIALGQAPTAKQDQYNRYKTVIVNGGFENGTTQWTASGGSFTASTSSGDFRSGLRGGVFDASSASQTLTSAANTISAGNNVVSCWFKTTANDYEFAAYDGTNKLVTQTIPPTSIFQKLTLNVALSANSQLRVRITSASNAAALYIDDCFSMEADNVGNGNFVTDWQSYTPTYTGFGTVSTSNILWRRVGDNIEIAGSFVSGTSTATEARLSLPTGLTSAGTGKIPNLMIAGTWGVDSTSITSYKSVLVEPSTSYVTFSLQNGSTNDLTKQNGSGIISNGTKMSIKASIPIEGWANVNLFNPADLPVWASVDATASSGLASTSSSSYTNVDDANFASKTYKGQAIAPSGANQFALRVSRFPIGAYYFIINAQVTSNGGSNPCGVRLYDGTNTIIENGSVFNASAIAADSYGGFGGVYVNTTNRTDVTFNVQFKSGGASSCYIGAQYGNASVTMIPLTVGVNAPLLIGGFTSSGLSAYRQELAEVSSSGTVSSETGDWVSGNCSNASSVYTCTLTTGYFSETPKCTATITGATTGEVTVSPSSATSVVVRTFNTSGTAADRSFMLDCKGAK
jgi:hypothetical protein